MNRLQKIALFNVCLAGIGLLIQLVRLLTSDMPTRLIASTITLLLCGFLGVSYFYRRKLAKQGDSQFDERDQSIHKSAVLTGCMVGFLVFFAAILMMFLSVGSGGNVKMGSVLGIFLLGAMSFFITESSTVLIKYGGEIKGERNE